MIVYQVKCNTAACLVNLGDLEKAILCYLEALHFHPRSEDAVMNLGVTLAGLKRYDEAAEVFDAHLSVFPDGSGTYSALCGKATCLYHLQKYAEGEFTATQAILLNNSENAECAQEIRRLCNTAMSRPDHAIQVKPSSGLGNGKSVAFQVSDRKQC
jgi:tetratricopeptide (TPR) repeat protein